MIGFFLLPFAFFFQVLIILKNIVSKKRRASIPVICVGNIYLGGTGKTPLSLEVVKTLEKFHKKTAIVRKDYTDHLDEFELIRAKNVKLFYNSSRFEAINDAVKNNYDCVVLDDGFQDLSIKKNLNIVCFTEKQLVGNGMTIPSGPLREPLTSLKRCQIIVINGKRNIDLEKKIKDISSNISIYYSKYLPINIEDFKEQNLLAFAGIGNPDNFFDILEQNNLKLIKKITFPDHYNYSLKELDKLINFSLENNLKLVTTEKDFFRIKHLKLPQIKCLNVKLEITDRYNFDKKIAQYL
jgi:tetraacyldisaccharide 4'-kinase